MIGSPLTSKFPDDSQASSLQVGLFKNSKFPACSVYSILHICNFGWHIIGPELWPLEWLSRGSYGPTIQKSTLPMGEVGLGGYIRFHLPPKDCLSHGFSIRSVPKHPVWLRCTCWTTNWWWVLFIVATAAVYVYTEAVTKQSHITLSWFPSFPTSSLFLFTFLTLGLQLPNNTFALKPCLKLWFLRCCLRHYALLGTSSHNATLVFSCSRISSVQSLSRVWLFATPCTEAHQASLSITTLGGYSNSCP